MFMKKLCLVDENLHIVTSEKNAVATVNLLEKQVVEITFLKPIAFNVARIEALRIIRTWKQKNYNVGNFHASLPECETCQKANIANGSPVFTDCHVVNSIGSSLNSKELTKLNQDGKPETTNLDETVKYVYVSLLISLLEFTRQNPKYKPEDFK